MYRLKIGIYCGSTLQEVILRDAPYLYRLAYASRDRPERKEMLRAFRKLRDHLDNAPISANCHQSKCKRSARWVTFPIDPHGNYWAQPYYWCDKHEPWDKSGVSEKLPIHFDVIKNFRTKGSQKRCFQQIKRALGFEKGARITEESAAEFFSNL